MPRYKSVLDLPPHLRAQIQAQGIELPSKRSKYGNVPTYVGRHRCASKLEAHRHQQLKMMTAHGLIRGHLSQVSVRLPSQSRMVLDELVNEPQTHHCKKCATAYICPVCGEVNSIDTLVPEDTKGLITEAWKVKCREFEQVLGVKIRIIQR